MVLRPLLILPKTVCLPSRCGHGAKVMKNSAQMGDKDKSQNEERKGYKENHV